MNECNFQYDLVCILISKKRCIISEDGKSILLKKGVSKKNAILKIRGVILPNTISTRTYQPLFVSEKSVEHLPFYN